MAVIVPTVTAEDAHTYRTQLEAVSDFASRIHLDFMDGLFAPVESIDLEQAWLPGGKEVDIHLMYMRPDLYIDKIIALKPSLVIVHAEANGNYNSFAEKLNTSGIRVGVALLQSTQIQIVSQSLESIDHVLIFSGKLGHFGGQVDFRLLEKVKVLKALKPQLEIGWDGGVSAENIRQLMEAGVDVLNVGGAIHSTDDPNAAYSRLRDTLEKSRG